MQGSEFGVFDEGDVVYVGVGCDKFIFLVIYRIFLLNFRPFLYLRHILRSPTILGPDKNLADRLIRFVDLFVQFLASFL